jgi:probable DNA repair protein
LLEFPFLLGRDLENGATLVVPSPQRAAQTRLGYAALKLAATETAWRTPDVLSLDAWLERESFRAEDAPHGAARPLSAIEEWLLWREATAAAAVAQGLPEQRLEPLVESLQRAARVLYDWRIPIAALQRSRHEESALLVRALSSVEERCTEWAAVGRHRLAAQVERSTPRRPVTFAGFTDRTPARAALLAGWSERSLPVREHRAEREPGRAGQVRAADVREEIERAAQWCRARLAGDPTRRLLVILPDLAAHRGTALQRFAEALSPERLLHEGVSAVDGLAVEGGLPLASYPLVQHAFLTLKLALGGRLEFPDFSAWLRGPFWGAPDASARAELEVRLRRAVPLSLGIPELRGALAGVTGDLASVARQVQDRVDAADRTIGSIAQRATPRHWVRSFDEALRSFGWPGARPLSSAEQQTQARFSETLADCAALAPHLGPVRADELLALAEALVTRTSYQPATGDAAVTLTDSLIDPIVRYDGIWVAGLHAERWPAPVRVNPFIPLDAQMQTGLARPARPLEEARALLGIWQRSTHELIVSSPATDGECELRPSPLIAELPLIGPHPPESQGREGLARSLRATARRETFEDPNGAPWTGVAQLRAGTRVIEYQSRCPFRAHAELRLSATRLEEPRPGIDARARGRLLHRSAELLWMRLGNSASLVHEARAGTLAALIEQSVSQAAAETLDGALPPVPPTVRRREQRRAVWLLRELAEIERGRAPFRVSGLEQRMRVALAGVTLDLRVDRIDELEDGARVVLDYKTGRASTPDLLGDRPTDPQLLVYLLAAPENVAALAVVALNSHGVAYRGLADRQGRLPRIAGIEAALRRSELAAPDATSSSPGTAWSGQVEVWRMRIERLVTDFLEGNARVDPAKDACRTCHLHAFCRIAEIERATDVATVTESEDG